MVNAAVTKYSWFLVEIMRNGRWERVRFQPGAWEPECSATSDRQSAEYGASLFGSGGMYPARVVEVVR